MDLTFFFAVSSPAISSTTIQYAQLQALYLKWSQSPINLLTNWYWLIFCKLVMLQKAVISFSKWALMNFLCCRNVKKNQLKNLIGSIIPGFNYYSGLETMLLTLRRFDCMLPSREDLSWCRWIGDPQRNRTPCLRSSQQWVPPLCVSKHCLRSLGFDAIVQFNYVNILESLLNKIVRK